MFAVSPSMNVMLQKTSLLQKAFSGEVAITATQYVLVMINYSMLT